MKKTAALVLAACLGWLPIGGGSAYRGEPNGFGDMHWGDSVKMVSERYAVKYLEETVGGGALYAVHFTDFTEQMGIRGPLVVTGAFEKGKLVQINVPLPLRSETDIDQAFTAYMGFLEQTCGAPDERAGDFAVWLGQKTTLYVEKTKEGILVCFMDGRRVGRARSGK